jgi:hypothetical protein
MFFGQERDSFLARIHVKLRMFQEDLSDSQAIPPRRREWYDGVHSTTNSHIDYLETLLRLAASVLVGGLIGLDRNLHGKPTGIGFLGSGVIIRENGSDRVRGLTTAVSIWITAILGILCGVGSWQIAGNALHEE